MSNALQRTGLFWVTGPVRTGSDQSEPSFHSVIEPSETGFQSLTSFLKLFKL